MAAVTKRKNFVDLTVLFASFCAFAIAVQTQAATFVGMDMTARELARLYDSSDPTTRSRLLSEFLNLSDFKLARVLSKSDALGGSAEFVRLLSNRYPKVLEWSKIIIGGDLPIPRGPIRLSAEDSVEAMEVYMGEYGVTSTKQTRFIQTPLIADCIALALYDPASETGALAHLTISNTAVFDSLDRILEEFRLLGIPVSRLQARLVGGYLPDSSELHAQIVTWLHREGVALLEKDVLNNKVYSIQLDLKTGFLEEYWDSVSNVPKREKALRQLGFDLFYWILKRAPRGSPPVGVSETQPLPRPSTAESCKAFLLREKWLP